MLFLLGCCFLLSPCPAVTHSLRSQSRFAAIQKEGEHQDAVGSMESRGQLEGGCSCLQTPCPHYRVGTGQGQHPCPLPPAVPVSHQPTKGNHLLPSDGLFHVAQPCKRAAHRSAAFLRSPRGRARLHLSYCSFSLFFSLNPFRNSAVLIDHERGTVSVGSVLGAAQLLPPTKPAPQTPNRAKNGQPAPRIHQETTQLLEHVSGYYCGDPSAVNDPGYFGRKNNLLPLFTSFSCS